ncbi:hypothetical protein AB6735_18655 [Mucilaginibacter sp. RCC_168]|uniref:hypothetical protein n=1 Tax=Mucilaginibacter sp. RCC_168 TaxID=3239221 RepID=UPI00352651EB
MKTLLQKCPECGGKLLPENISPLIYACEGCTSLHEAGKPLYTYCAVFAVKAPISLLKIN